jgi:hypothetical protein
VAPLLPPHKFNAIRRGFETTGTRRCRTSSFYVIPDSVFFSLFNVRTRGAAKAAQPFSKKVIENERKTTPKQ